jgi:AcrR family transcriptional regulator
MTDSKKAAELRKGRLQRQKRGLATRRELLRSARYVFARDGFEHARLEDIALRARKTRGAFYDNFKDKEDVFFAIFEEDKTHDLTELGNLILALPTLDERIDALVEYVGDLCKDLERILLNLEFKLYAIRHPRKRKRLADLYRAMQLRTSIPEFSKLLPQLNGHPTDARLTDSLAVCGIVDGLALSHLFDPDGLDRKALLRYLKVCMRETLPAASKQKERKKIAPRAVPEGLAVLSSSLH